MLNRGVGNKDPNKHFSIRSVDNDAERETKSERTRLRSSFYRQTSAELAPQK